ncbi:hypothetical protein AcW1_008912 [Taiwanofungus camphoratus]|nr:hypothetical protein AcW1_008912 [Antrodia cinnamomea]KAI0958938.1 hypothetical protein AcV7_004617 [Antrodia cinnamomea]
MRLPQHVYDKNVLQDEPFLSLFEIRRNSKPSRSVNWNAIIAEGFNHSDDNQAAVSAWLQLAFPLTPGQASHAEVQLSADTDELHVFIEFYWKLFLGSFERNIKKSETEARQFLQREQAVRGYRDRRPRKQGGRCVGGTKVSTGRGANSLPSTQHPRRSGKSLRKRHTPDDAYDAEASQEEDDAPIAIAVPSTELLVRDTIIFLPQPEENGNTTRGSADDTNATTLHLDSPPEIARHRSTSDGPSGHQEEFLAFTNKTSRALMVPEVALVHETTRNKLAGYKRKAVSEFPSGSSPPSPSGHDTCSAAAVIRSREGVCDDELTSLTELSSDETSIDPELPTECPDPEASIQKDVNNAVSGNLRRPRRTASNVQNLSKIMQMENKHEEHLRRGYLNISENSSSDCESDSRKQLPTRAKVQSMPCMKKTKTSTTTHVHDSLNDFHPAPQVDVSSLAVVSSPIGQEPVATGRMAHELNTSSRDSLKVPPNYPSKGKSPASTIRGKRSKQCVPEHPGRPAKCSRCNTEETRGTLASVMMMKPVIPENQRRGSARLQQVELQPDADRDRHTRRPARVLGEPLSHGSLHLSPESPKRARSPAVVQGGTHNASNLTTTLPSRAARKRSRAAFEGLSDQHSFLEETTADSTHRDIAKLPKRHTPHKRTPLTNMPAQLDKRSKQHLTLTDVDTVIRQAAVEAQMQKAETAGVTSDWEDEDDADFQDRWADSSDDDITVEEALTSQSSLTGEENTLLVAPPGDVPAYVPPVVHAQARRPRLPVKPPIWAQSRQEVCESFDWFRSYQGGVYFLKDMVKGYLLSAFSSSRDIFAHDGRLIISHGGGKAESLHTREGHSEQHEADDQLADDKSVRALLNTCALQRPIALLVDDKYSLFPFDLAADGYTYVVLGFYHIAHAWAERQPAQNSRGYVVRYKFAFHWCEQQGKPWWISSELSCSNTQPDSSVNCNAYEMQPVSAESTSCNQTHWKCPKCNTMSPIVYAQGWMCLQPRCVAFWKTKNSVQYQDLEYAASFLCMLGCNHDKLEDLRPPLPVTKVLDGITTSRVFCKGWHCVQCGRLSSRYKWEHWECQNCGTTHKVTGRRREPKEFWRQKGPDAFLNHCIAVDSGIIVSSAQLYNYGKGYGAYYSYILPQNRGRIFLITGNPLANSEANTIFEEYQEQAANGKLLFRRWPLRSHKCRGTLLTNYFSQNSGEPYQYVGGTDNTVPWESAPTAVRHALALIERRMKNALGMPSPFNEVLSASYMEKQKMAFHSDSERGLGPVVASLSLGSSAYMHFRLHTQYSNESGRGSSRNALTLFLRHGDVLVMAGDGVQKYYEHTVVPLNFRIAATARFIGNQNA